MNKKLILAMFFSIVVTICLGKDALAVDYYYDKYNTNESWGAEQSRSLPGFGTKTLFPSASWNGSSYVTSGSGTSYDGTSGGTGWTVSNGSTQRDKTQHYWNDVTGSGWETIKYYRNKVYSKGGLVQLDIIAADGTYPTDGRHSDGFWYVRKGLVAIDPNLSITTPIDIKIGPSGSINIAGTIADFSADTTISVVIDGVKKSQVVSGGSGAYSLTWNASEVNDGLYENIVIKADDTSTVLESIYEKSLIVDKNAPVDFDSEIGYLNTNQALGDIRCVDSYNSLYVIGTTAGAIDLYKKVDGTYKFLNREYIAPGLSSILSVEIDDTYVYAVMNNGYIYIYTYVGYDLKEVYGGDGISGNGFYLKKEGGYIHVSGSSDTEAYTFDGTNFTKVSTNKMRTYRKLGVFDGKLHAMDVASPYNVGVYTFDGTSYTLVASVATNSSIKDYYMDGTYFYILHSDNTISVYEYDGNTTISFVDSIVTGTAISKISAIGNYIYVPKQDGGGILVYKFNGSALTYETTYNNGIEYDEVFNIKNELYLISNQGNMDIKKASGNTLVDENQINKIADVDKSVTNGNYVFANDGINLIAFKIINNELVKLHEIERTTTEAASIHTSGNYVVVLNRFGASAFATLYTYDEETGFTTVVANKSIPNHSTGSKRVSFNGAYMYVARGDDGLFVYELVGNELIERGSITGIDYVKNVVAEGSYVYVSTVATSDEIKIYTFDGSTFAYKTSIRNNNYDIRDFIVDGNYIYVANDGAKLGVYKFDGTTTAKMQEATSAGTQAKKLGKFKNKIVGFFTGGYLEVYGKNSDGTLSAVKTFNVESISEYASTYEYEGKLYINAYSSYYYIHDRTFEVTNIVDRTVSIKSNAVDRSTISHMMISEKKDFSDTTWIAYTDTFSKNVSNYGINTIYIKLKDEHNQESKVTIIRVDIDNTMTLTVNSDYEKVGPTGTVSITGNVSSAKVNDITVSSMIDGILKQDIVTGGSGAYTLTWNASELSSHHYRDVIVTATNGIEEEHTCQKSIVVDKEGPKVENLIDVDSMSYGKFEAIAKYGEYLIAGDSKGRIKAFLVVDNKLMEVSEAPRTNWSSTEKIIIQADKIYVLKYSTFEVYTFSNMKFTKVGEISLGNSRALYMDSNYIYVGTYADELKIYDISTLAFKTSIATGDNIGDVYVDSNYIYVANLTSGLNVYTFDGTTLTLKKNLNVGKVTYTVSTDTNYTYIGQQNDTEVYTFDGTTFTLESVTDKKVREIIMDEYTGEIFARYGSAIYRFYRNSGKLELKEEKEIAGSISDFDIINGEMAISTQFTDIYTASYDSRGIELIDKYEIIDSLSEMVTNGEYTYVRDGARIFIYKTTKNRIVLEKIEDYSGQYNNMKIKGYSDGHLYMTSNEGMIILNCSGSSLSLKTIFKNGAKYESKMKLKNDLIFIMYTDKSLSVLEFDGININEKASIQTTKYSSRMEVDESNNIFLLTTSPYEIEVYNYNGVTISYVTKADAGSVQNMKIIGNEIYVGELNTGLTKYVYSGGSLTEDFNIANSPTYRAMYLNADNFYAAANNGEFIKFDFSELKNNNVIKKETAFFGHENISVIDGNLNKIMLGADGGGIRYVFDPHFEAVASGRDITVNSMIYDESNITDMIISDEADFSGASWIPYSTTYNYMDNNYVDKTIYIKARDEYGQESAVKQFTFTYDKPEVSVTDKSNDRIDLNVINSGVFEAGSEYQVYRSTLANLSDEAIVKPYDTNIVYSDTGLDAETMYYYRVKVKRNGKEGNYSDVISEKTIRKPIFDYNPKAVTSSDVTVEITNVGGGSISYSTGDWTEVATSGGSGYPTTSPGGGNVLMNNDINDNETTFFEITGDIAEINFQYYVSSESNYNWFRFYVDGAEVVKKSGTVAWTFYAKNDFTPGNHTVKFEYKKDGSVNGGADAAFLDEINVIGQGAGVSFKYRKDGAAWQDYTVPVVLSENALVESYLVDGAYTSEIVQLNITNISKEITINLTEVDQKIGPSGTITISGDIVNIEDTTVSAIIGGVKKSQVVSGGTGAFTLSWLGSELSDGVYREVAIRAKSATKENYKSYSKAIKVDKKGPDLTTAEIAEEKHTTTYGAAKHNDYIISANRHGWINAYSNENGELVKIATTKRDGYQVMSVISDGMYIYVANDSRGVVAYTFDGETFALVGSIDDGGNAKEVYKQGAYIYIANYTDGLRAYTFDGSAFTNVGHIDDGGIVNSVYGDGTYIYIANDTDGVRAYTFDGTTFTNVGHLTNGDTSKAVYAAGGYVYVGNETIELEAYTFDGSVFTKKGDVNISGDAECIRSDGTYIYLGNDELGLLAYTFNGTTFSNVGSINDGGYAVGLFIDGEDIYLANHFDGLRLYNFDGSTFTNIDKTKNGGDAREFYTDGTYMYIANYNNGLKAYTFDGTSIVEKARRKDGSYVFGVTGDGTYIYVANYAEGLKAYTFDGTAFTSVATINEGGRAEGVVVQGGYIYIANGSDGLRAYTFNGTTFTNVGHIDDGGDANGIHHDGTYIYIANDTDGLRAYTFNGSAFTNVGHINNGGRARSVHSDSKYVYLANEDDALRAYTFDGATFTNVGHVGDSLDPSEVKGVYADGDYVYMGALGGGTVVYTFDGISFKEIVNLSEGLQSNKPYLDNNDYLYIPNSAYGFTINKKNDVTIASITNTDVQLEINPYDMSTITDMMISNKSDFSGASWIAYNTSYTYNGAGYIDEILYVKLKDEYGQESEVKQVVVDYKNPKVAVTDKSSNYINLEVTNTADFEGGTEYEYYRSTQADLSDEAIVRAYSTTATFNDNTVLDNAIYYYRVRTKRNTKVSNYSIVNEVSTLKKPVLDHNPKSNTTGDVTVTITNEIGTERLINSFEDGKFTEWVNAVYDDAYNFQIHEGSTPSSSTGPSAAYDGDKYIYIEASDLGANKNVSLEGPGVAAGEKVKFNYHMYGANIGTLKLQGYDAVWEDLWTMSGDQGNSWAEALVDISKNYSKLRFDAVVGIDYKSDISLDNIRIISKPNLKYRIDGAAWQNYTVPVVISDNAIVESYLADGAYTSEIVTLNITNIDKVVPMVTFATNGNATPAKSQSTIVTASDSGSGVVLLEYVWSTSDTTPGGGWTTFNSGDTLTQNTGSGNYYLHIKAEDNAGNVGHTKSNLFKVDNTLQNIVFGTNGNSTYAKSQSTTATVHDSISGVATSEYQWSTSSATPSGGWIPFINGSTLTQSTGIGNYYLHVRGVDNSGNEEIRRTNVFKLDNALQSIVFEPNGNNTYEKSQSSRVTVNDSLSGVATSEYQWSTSSATPSGGWIAFVNGSTLTQSTGSGNYYLHARGVDNAGNEEFRRTSVFRLDNTNPIAPTLNLDESWINGDRKFTVTDGFDADSGIQKLQYKIGTGAWTDYAGETTALTTTGQVTVYARAIDNAGNISSEVSKVASVDKDKPTASSSSITEYDYKNGMDYWIKEGNSLKVKVRHSDANAGIKTQFLLLSVPDANAADHDWMGTATNLNEYNTSTYSKITAVSETYEAGNEKEVEWTVSGINEAPLGWIVFGATDNAGVNSDASAAGQLGIDGTVPSIVFGTNGSATYAQNHSTILTAEDTLSGLASIEYSWEFSATTPSSGWNAVASGTVLEANGAPADLYLHVRATDNVGNVSTTHSNVFKVDNTDPTAPVITVNESWSNVDENFTLSGATDAHSGINKMEYKLSGATTLGWTTYTVPVAISNEGTTTIEARAVDNAGNISTIATKNAKIDKVLPSYVSSSVTQAAYNSGSDYWIKIGVGEEAKIKIRGRDVTSGMRYSYLRIPTTDYNMAHHNWTGTNTHIHEEETSVYTDITGVIETYEAGGEYEAEWTVKGLATMPLNRMEYYFTDMAGNTLGYIPTGLKLGVDNTSPGAPVISADTNWRNANESVTIAHGADAESGVNRSEYRLTGATTLGWTTYTVPVVISNEGTTVIEARTIDNVGNIGSIDTKSVKIDKTNPTGAFVPNSQAAFGNTDVAFALNTADTLSGVSSVQIRHSLDGGSTYVTGWLNVASPTYNGSLSPSEGRRVMQAKVVDVVGNETIVTSGVYNIDKTKPTDPTVTANSNWINTNQSITVTPGVDALSGVNRTEYRLTGSTSVGWTTYTAPVVVSNEGTTTLEARTIDNAGNASNVVSDFVKIDKTKPVRAATTVNDSDSMTVTVTASDALSGLHDTETYTYYMQKEGDAEENLGSTTNNVYTYNSVKRNAKYTFKQETKDRAGNINVTGQFYTYGAANPGIDIMSTEDASLKVLITPNPLNLGNPEVKIKGVNIFDGGDIVESGWSRLGLIELPGFTLNQTYKITAEVRSDHGVLNPEITLADKQEFVGEVDPPYIESFEINYGDATTTERYVDLKLVASPAKETYGPLKVQFTLDGVRKGFVNGVWQDGVYGDYAKYYPAFDLGNAYGVRTIYVTVRDLINKTAVSVKEINRITVESATPKVEVVPKEDREDEVKNGSIKYLDNGFLMTSERLVRLKLKATNAKQAQYSLDSIKWSPWENVVNGYINKNITLNDEPGDVKTVYARTKNEYGKVSGMEVTYYVLDQTAPEIDIQTSNNVNIAVNGNLSLRLEFNDKVSEKIDYKLTFRKDGADVITREGEADNKVSKMENFTGLGSGFYSIKVEVYDELGNKDYKTMNIWSK